MPHQHHDGCGHEAHDHDHDHDHDDPQNLGYQDNLYAHIDRPNVIALNAEGKAADVIKPWNERMDETKVNTQLIYVLTWACQFENGSVSRVRCRRPTVRAAF